MRICGRGHWPLDAQVGIEDVRLELVEPFPPAPPYEQSDEGQDESDATDYPANNRTCIDGGRLSVGTGNDRRSDCDGGKYLSVGIRCDYGRRDKPR